MNDHNTTRVGGGSADDPTSEIATSAHDGSDHNPTNEHGSSAAAGSVPNTRSGYGQGSTGGGDFLDDPTLADSYDDDDYYGEPGYSTGRPDAGGPMGGMDTRTGVDTRGRRKMGLAAGVGGRSSDGTEHPVENEHQGYGTGTLDEGGPWGGMDTNSGVNRRGEIITGLGPGPGGRITRSHKPTTMEKLRGTTETMAGKVTGNSELVNRGEERKRGEL